MKGVRLATAIGMVVVVAAAAFWVWQRTFSRAAQIDAVHRGCIAEFAQAAARIKPGATPGEKPSAMAKGILDGLGRIIDGMSGSMSDTVCATLRDACREDFDGRMCTAARERYR